MLGANVETEDGDNGLPVSIIAGGIGGGVAVLGLLILSACLSKRMVSIFKARRQLARGTTGSGSNRHITLERGDSHLPSTADIDQPFSAAEATHDLTDSERETSMLPRDESLMSSMPPRLGQMMLPHRTTSPTDRQKNEAKVAAELSLAEEEMLSGKAAATPKMTSSVFRTQRAQIAVETTREQIAAAAGESAAAEDVVHATAKLAAETTEAAPLAETSVPPRDEGGINFGERDQRV